MGKVKSIPSQNQRILEYIGVRGGITQFDAIKELGILRLASRVSDLRRLGYPISSEWVVVKNRYGEETKVKRYSIENGFSIDNLEVEQ